MGRIRVRIVSVFFSVVIFLLFYFLPFDDIEPSIKITAGIFLTAVILWVTEAIPLYITSFVILFLEALFLTPHLHKVSYKVFITPFFSSIIVLFLGGFTISRALKVYNIDLIFAKKIIKTTKGSTSLILVSFMAITAFLSMFMSNTATTALMIGVSLPFVEQLRKDKGRIAILLGIPFAANIGGMATPIGTPPNAIAIEALRQEGINISFLDWTIRAFPLAVLFIFVLFILLKVFYPFESKRIDFIEDKNEHSVSKKGVFIIIIVVLTISLWLTGKLHHIPSSMVALIPLIVFFSTGVLSRSDLGKLGWDTLLLIGGGLSLGTAIKISGLGEWFVKGIGIVNSIPLIIIISGFLLTVVLSNFISNTSATALILPIVLSFGLFPFLSAFGVAICASMAMLLPISTPPNAIAYGSGMLRIKDMAKIGTMMIAIGVVSIIIIAFVSIKGV